MKNRKKKGVVDVPREIFLNEDSDSGLTALTSRLKGGFVANPALCSRSVVIIAPTSSWGHMWCQKEKKKERERSEREVREVKE